MVLPESNAVHAKVYDHMRELEAQAATPVQTTPEIELTRFALKQEEHLEVLQAQIALSAKKVKFFDNFADRKITIIDLVRMFDGVNTTTILRDLKDAGVMYEDPQGYRVHSEYRNTYFKECQHRKPRKMTFEALAKGKLLLAKLYFEGKLTMRINRLTGKRCTIAL